MKGVVEWVNKKKGYGFIYGTGCIEKDGKENVLPKYFFHFSQLKNKRIRELDMVKFKPHTDKKGMSALNVSIIEYSTEDDPRAYIARRIYDEFDMEIPCLSWSNILFEEMKDIYDYLKADKANDEAELNRISDVYELSEVPKKEHIVCIAAGGADMWKYDKEQMKNNGYWED